MTVNDVVLIKDENKPRNRLVNGCRRESGTRVSSGMQSLRQTSELHQPVYKLVLKLTAENRMDTFADSLMLTSAKIEK